MVLRVEYEVHHPACGLHFHGGYAATANQVRRTSAWLPCVDVPLSAVDYQLQLTVRSDEVAVGPGQLVRQTSNPAEPRWRTYHYKLPLPCAPCQLAFAVGPFSIVPSQVSLASGRPAGTVVTHFAPPRLAAPMLPTSPLVAGSITADAADLWNPGGQPAGAAGRAAGKAGGALADTARFFSLPMSLFESLLGQCFPLPSMQQVFVPEELLPDDVQVGVGIQILSTRYLLSIRSIEQSLEARRVMARALARQWFGVFMRPAAPADAWLLDGLAGWLEEQYIKKYLGNNELQYRRWREQAAIYSADNGDAPPLSWRGAATPSPWGRLYGTQALDPSDLPSLKATAVIGMLERRAGDMFKKHLERVVGAACHPEPGTAPTDANNRTLDTMAFLTELGKAGSFRKEVPALAERWVYRRGVPHITAGFLYHRRKSVLELAVRQSGSEAAKTAADMAERVAKQQGTGAGVIKAGGLVKVAVREYETVTEHPVHLGGHAAVLGELKVNPEVKKPPGRRGGRGRKKGEGEDGGIDGEGEMKGEDGGLRPQEGQPVQWVRIDPGGEWLCSTRVLQPERCWLAQLQHSKDVVAQAEAVQGLLDQAIALGTARKAVLDALARVLESRDTYYRVRQDAAVALAAIRDTEGNTPGLDTLLRFYKERHYDKSADPPCPKPTPVTDPAEYLVAQAVVAAIARCKDPDGMTCMDALLFLMEELDAYQSKVGGYDDSGLVAAMCEGLGGIQTDLELLDSYLTILEDYLQRDVVAPSPNSLVGCACLSAMSQLARSTQSTPEIRGRVQDTLVRCLATPRLPLPLKQAAHAAAIHLLAAAGGAEAALRYAVRAVGGHLDIGYGSSGDHAMQASHDKTGSHAPESLPAGPEAGISQPGEPPPAPSEAEAAAMEVDVADGGGEAAGAAEAGGAAAAAAGQETSQAVAGQQVPLQQRPQERVGAGLDASTPSRIWEEVIGVAAGRRGRMTLSTLRGAASLLNAGHDCGLRHRVFMTLRRLQRQPPTLYQPPSLEDEELMIVASQPAVSHGVTRRTGAGAGPAPSAAAPAATHDSRGAGARAAGAGAKKVTLKLYPSLRPGGPSGVPSSLGAGAAGGPETSGGAGGVFSGVFSGGGGLGVPSLSPTVSEVLQPDPWQAMGTQFFPVRPDQEEGEEVGTRLRLPLPPAPSPLPAALPIEAAEAAATAAAPMPPEAAALALPAPIPTVAAPAPEAPQQQAQQQLQPPLQSGPSRGFKLRLKAPSLPAPLAPAGAAAGPEGPAPQMRVPPDTAAAAGPEGAPGALPGDAGEALVHSAGQPRGSSKAAAKRARREPSPLSRGLPGLGGGREASPGAAQAGEGAGVAAEVAVGAASRAGHAQRSGAGERPRSKQAKREKTPVPAAGQAASSDGGAMKLEVADALLAYMEAAEKAEAVPKAKASKPKKRKQPLVPAGEQPAGTAAADGAAASPTALPGDKPAGKRPRPTAGTPAEATAGPAAAPQAGQPGGTGEPGVGAWTSPFASAAAEAAAPDGGAGGGGSTGQLAPGARKAEKIQGAMPRVVLKGQERMERAPSWAQRAVKGSGASAAGAAGPPMPGAGRGVATAGLAHQQAARPTSSVGHAAAAQAAAPAPVGAAAQGSLAAPAPSASAATGATAGGAKPPGTKIRLKIKSFPRPDAGSYPNSSL
ncbi:hypothetical protein N2152v2_005121 [Parachlorella kessleri]